MKLLALSNVIDLLTDYTVSAQDILTFDKCSTSVRKMYLCGQESAIGCFFYSSKCGIHFTRTVIAQGVEAQVSTGREIESAWVQIFLHTVLNTANTYII